jgi:hypothetical protein
MSRKIIWTPKQTEVANLLRQGKSTKEVQESGHSIATIKRVRAAIKDELAKVKKRQAQPGSGGSSGGPLQNLPDSWIKPRTLDVIEVGGIIIEPADWRINQFGAFLILTTYEIAKQEYGYEGTVGEFICDSVQLLRKIIGLDLMTDDYLLKEGGNGTGRQGQEASEGRPVSKESRGGPDRE